MPRRASGRRTTRRSAAGWHSHRHHVGHRHHVSHRHHVGQRHTVAHRHSRLRSQIRTRGYGFRGLFGFGLGRRVVRFSRFFRRRRTRWRPHVRTAPTYPGITSWTGNSWRTCTGRSYGPYYGAKNLPPPDVEEAERLIKEYRERLLRAYEGTPTTVYPTTVAWSAWNPYSQDGRCPIAIHTIQEEQQCSQVGSNGSLSQINPPESQESEGYERRALYMDSYSSGRPSSDSMTYNRQGPSRGRDKGRADPAKDEKLGCCVVS